MYIEYWMSRCCTENFLDIKAGSEKTLVILERDSNAKDRSRSLSISNFADLTQF